MTADLLKLQRIPREVARWQKAQQVLLSDGRGHALGSYRELVQRFPGIPQLWFEMGIGAMGELDFELAEQSFRRAEQLAPKDVSMLVLLGQQYHRLRRLDQARGCFERAVAADPSSVHARLSLAAWYERERRLDDAWAHVEKSLERNPREPQVLCVRALLLHRKGRNSEAESVLRGVVQSGSREPNVNFSSRHLLAVVLDELGQYDEAMRWLVEAKELARKMGDTAAMERDYDRADRRRRELLASFNAGTVAAWGQEGPAVRCDFQLALLGGHPRSGTTLLEQLLSAHPEMLGFDESEAFANEIWHQLAAMQASQALSLAELDRLPAARRAELGERYLKSLRREVKGGQTARVLLDKNPSPTAALHLFLRIFPNLKVLIALRDPRDVVISCFFQNLMLTPTNANFLSLERTVKHYADLMDVWLRLRELGGFEWLETRYENVVDDAEAEGSRAMEFLGLAWHPDQAQHQEVARRKVVFSPTYNDVAKPIHKRAVGRWQNYAAALASLQEKLAPYCRAFGYDTVG